jgi:hypothetical protein
MHELTEPADGSTTPYYRAWSVSGTVCPQIGLRAYEFVSLAPRGVDSPAEHRFDGGLGSAFRQTQCKPGTTT